MLTDGQIKRFFKKVNKTSGCWIWIGAINNYGYGMVQINGSKHSAHRISYEIAKGAIADNLQIDHLCRNRRCINPEHLEAITQKENLLRGETIAAKNKSKTHCPKGHPYSKKNTIMKNKGGGYRSRQCRICRNEKEKTKYHRKKLIQ
jgi:hypothetical protein